VDSSNRQWVIPLAEAADADEGLIGGKASKLAKLARADFRVPDGFCITAEAYEHFLSASNIASVIRMELGRKPFGSMRWEEIWDTALRIRNAFVSRPLPTPVRQAVSAATVELGINKAYAVRSSAPEEDSAARSFAGLHESVVGVVGVNAILDAIRVVWASLWSDAALLYRQELSLDPSHSCMAVLVQEMIDQDRSGVAFSRDPRDTKQDHAIVEAVPGPCSDLVDGLVDPDRWILKRSSGDVISWRPGQRNGEENQTPILDISDLQVLLQQLLRLESLFGWSPDMEWTGRGDHLTLLQARPITTTIPESDDQRQWYLTLRPGRRRLSALAERVSNELIPQWEQLGESFAAEAIEGYDNTRLAQAIEERWAALQEWKQIYRDDFIPFAHGVRQLGTYYNDALQPQDPYEFVGLLKGERMVATQRNQALEKLAGELKANSPLFDVLRNAARQDALEKAKTLPGGLDFVRGFEELLNDYMDVAYGGQRLSDRPDLILESIMEMARSSHRFRPQSADQVAIDLQQRLLDAVSDANRKEALEVIRVGRLSWRLRDDDNVLIGRVESQLLRALDVAAGRLVASGRLDQSVTLSESASSVIAKALRDPLGGAVVLSNKHEKASTSPSASVEASPRQLIGQPAAPGLATGAVRIVRDTEGLRRFRTGDVLVCDAIQPAMTHLVPLACAIIERRGGMLIHGSIIARELGIPCVNGILDVVELLSDGDLVTVDGYLGIVTVGAPLFDLEGV
jgi:pyruvate,water dikinase